MCMYVYMYMYICIYMLYMYIYIYVFMCMYMYMYMLSGAAQCICPGRASLWPLARVAAAARQCVLRELDTSQDISAIACRCAGGLLLALPPQLGWHASPRHVAPPALQGILPSI